MSKRQHPEARSAAPGGSRAARRAASLRCLRSRALMFVALCVASLAVAGGYVTLAWNRKASAAGVASVVSVGDPAAIGIVRERPHLTFISTAVGDTYGKIALAPLAAPDQLRFGTALNCDRVHFAAGQGLCLAGGLAAGLYSAYTVDGDLQPGYTFRQGGIPSRVRVSPDGRHGAMTMFVSGHSYAEAGFSTQTTLIDMGSGAALGDLEGFAVYRDGARFQAEDFNFWGVTFARDGNRFYATLGSGGKVYLVEGDLPARQARVLAEGVECPSLSPDDTRLAFKKRVDGDGRPGWLLHLLDLATLVETPLGAEGRSVDDQVEWLDDHHIVYAIADDDRPPVTTATNIWVLPVDGSGPPRIFVHQAHSPAVIRAE